MQHFKLLKPNQNVVHLIRLHLCKILRLLQYHNKINKFGMKLNTNSQTFYNQGRDGFKAASVRASARLASSLKLLLSKR